MSPFLHRFLRSLLVLALILAGSSCAVTRIDVDVYKGPLANVETVQAEQFAVMAIAAKPLLIRLRDTLEWPPREPKPPDYQADYPKPPDYQADYMPAYEFANKQAGRVNAALSLYHDTTLRGLWSYSYEVQPALRNYGVAYSKLKLARSSLWERVAAGMRSDVPATFKQKYQLYLEPKDDLSTATPIAVAYEDNYFSAITNAEYVEGGFGNDLSANAVYERLANPKVVEIHAKILFKDPASPLATEFKAAVLDKARSYAAARKELRIVWLASLNTLLAMEGLGLTEEQRTTTKKSLAWLIAQITQPQHIAALFCYQKAMNQSLSRLETVLSNYPASTGLWDRDVFARANDLLETALIHNPNTATELLKADVTFAEGPLYSATCPIESVGGKKQYDTPLRKKYGFVRGPSLQIDYEKLDSLVGRVAPGAAEGLERGRLPEGLQTTVDRYLQLSASRDKDDPAVLAARELLLSSVVQFATKILALANNNSLFPPESAGTDPSTKAALQPYVAVLQAVGNSLIVQADELRHQSEHRERMKQRAPTEAQALGAGLTGSAASFADNLLKDLRAPAQALAKAKQAQAAAEVDAGKATTALGGAQATLDRLKADADAKGNAAIQQQNSFATVRDAWETLKLNADDEARVRKAAEGGPEGPADGAAVMQSIVDWVANQSTSPGLDEAGRARLKATEVYLKGLKSEPAIATITAADKTSVFQKILTIIEGDYDNRKKQVDASLAEKQKADQALETQTQTVAKLKAASEQAQKSVDARRETVRVATANNSEVDDARIAIEARLPSVLAKAYDAGLGASPQVALAQLTSTISDDLRTATDDTEKKQLTAAAGYLKTRAPPLASINVSPAAPKQHETAADVLDRLIAALRYVYILAVKEYGVDSAGATKINQAIKAAYDQRSGMAYIRPSNAYLRSSYTASALLANPGLGWQNMLKEQTMRASPFFSETMVNAGTKKQLEVIGDIDKQFWQNINSVRVSGAGLTNYVMTKDDIGNWYVKSYSSDPSKIIQAAKSLALYNLGGAANPSLLKGAGSAAQPSGSSGAATTTGLERVFREYQGRYTATTKADYEKALRLDTAFDTGIQSAWDNDPALKSNNAPVADFKKDLAASTAQLRTELDALKGAKEADQGAQIVNALEALRRSYLLLASKIRDRNIPSGQIAIRDASAVTRSILLNFTKSREESVKSFETAIMFVGEAAK